MVGAANAELGTFLERIRQADASVPLLVLRVSALANVAWRNGQAAARRAERRCWESFATQAARTLRSGDLSVHEPGTLDFLTALLSDRASQGERLGSRCARAALRRLAAQFGAGGTAVEHGWIMVEGGIDKTALPDTIERALHNGARERERYEFFALVGHELRTPLSAIRAYAASLLEEHLEPQTFRRYLEGTQSEALRLSRLVDGMFDLALLDLQGSRPSASCLLQAAVTAAAAATTTLASARRCRFECAPCSEITIGLAADTLVQVLINLLDNAFKHGRENGYVRVSAVAHPSYVEVFVDDDGPGIAADERDAMFALGRRSARARARGSGLGLAVARLLLDRSDATIEATDSPLGGARFRLCLPASAD